MSQDVRAVAVSPAMVKQRASDLVKSDARVLVLRARPDWPHGDVRVGDTDVKVVPGVSQLAILDAYSAMDENDYLIVLTDRPADDLGEAVLARAYKQIIDFPDEWAAVPRLFPGAREVSRELRRLDWAATALLDHQPTGGWPHSVEPAVTAKHALGSLLTQILRIGASADLDAVVLLTVLGRREVRSSWADADSVLRKQLIDWAGTEFGAPASFALNVAQSQEHITPLAVALALDVLWPDDGSVPGEAQVAARVRAETYVNGKTIAVEDATAVARAARSAVLRLELDEAPALGVALQQAEALLGDLGWLEGAEQSTILRPGYTARLRRLAVALDDGTGYEDALRDLSDHRDAGISQAPAMAVRLARWLATPEARTSCFADDVQRHMVDGGWVDRALGAVWHGSDEPAVAAAYERLIQRVRDRRRARDQVAADRLAQTLTVGDALEGFDGDVVGVERLLGDVVVPWQRSPVLLIVLDGMSGAIATQLAEEIARSGLMEWVPSSTRQRLAAVAALPTMTNVSRTSLFCGDVRDGDSADEKRGFTEAILRSVLFHKGDLRSPSGAALPENVIRAMNDEKVPVVGAVLNAIDDSIHKSDTSAAEWDLGRIESLRALLDAAVAARRTVIVTSDHGHVVERDTEALAMSGADARWRPPSTGAVQAGEVLVNGPRVMAAGDEAILLWRDDAHFGPRRSGYHGGASLAEITVPVLVFQPATVTQGADGWEPATPQAPFWWNDPVMSTATTAQPVKRTTPTRSSTPMPGQSSLFETTPEAPAERTDVVDTLLASQRYAEQRRMAGRGALPDDTVAAALRAVIERGGRAHHDTVAAAAGIGSTEIGQVLAGIRRLLNVDGYGVIEVDADGETLRLDQGLLREQFEIGAAG